MRTAEGAGPASELHVRPSNDIAALNNRPAGKKVCSVVVHSQVDLWSASRCLADHGMFNYVKPPTVREMYPGVLRFLGEQFG